MQSIPNYYRRSRESVERQQVITQTHPNIIFRIFRPFFIKCFWYTISCLFTNYHPLPTIIQYSSFEYLPTIGMYIVKHPTHGMDGFQRRNCPRRKCLISSGARSLSSITRRDATRFSFSVLFSVRGETGLEPKRADSENLIYSSTPCWKENKKLILEIFS